VAPGAAATPRVTRQRLRRLPSPAAAINRGLRASPGFAKPAAVAHDASRRAGKAGFQHRHKPFFFKRGGHRWKRLYYTYPLGGLWYWYWYDVIADDDPAVVVYSYDALPECDEDDDDCSYVEDVSDGELIAPAILEGRATEDMMEQCEDRYRSFVRRTGTYTTYDGEKRVCRYLR
jgi:hypothetical protein